MEFVRRLASPDVASLYPLEITGRAQWRCDNDTLSIWQQEISLPDIPAGHIIVPSFALYHGADNGYAFNFSLHTGATVFPLHPVPNESADKPVTAEPVDGAVSCHIDCWHSEQALTTPKIRLSVTSATKPECYLLTLSIRPLQNDAPADITEARNFAPDLFTPVPASISQMQAAKEINSRICSPTALAMALSVFDDPPGWSDTIEACYDPKTRAYGAWPLAIQWASRHGIIGAVEAIANWREVIKILQAGIPLVCSIRFARGKLAGAPLAQTAGHLVTLYGLGGDYVHVKDPAAANDKQVDKRYRLDEFSEAWLSTRGAAYIFCGNVMQNQQETT